MKKWDNMRESAKTWHGPKAVALKQHIKTVQDLFIEATDLVELPLSSVVTGSFYAPRLRLFAVAWRIIPLSSIRPSGFIHHVCVVYNHCIYKVGPPR